MSLREEARWKDMMDSCYDQGHPSYSFNGRIGITVCNHWHVFENFLKDIGYMPGDNSYLDRELGTTEYNPLTTEWRKSRERMLKFHYKTLSLKQWAEELNLPIGTINTRIKRNLPVSQVLTTGKLYPKDLAGTRVGMLTVKHYVKTNGTLDMWFAKCDCGNEVVVASRILQTKKFRSCGCVHSKDVAICRNKLPYKGKLRGIQYWSKEYNVPVELIKKRIRAGLTVSQALGDSPLPVRITGTRELSFLTGIPESTLRHRKILNVNPSDLKSSFKLQTGKLYEYKGTYMTLEQWAVECNEKVSLLRNRIYAGWNLVDVLEIPSNFMERIK